jgi:tRNA (guanine10-N2)-methyltransferase
MLYLHLLILTLVLLLLLLLLLSRAGGRLVFFMPASPETYREDQLPVHPMLALVSNVEQPLQSRYSRRLVTMLKVRQRSST